MALRVSIAKLRGIKLPPQRVDEPDHLVALRNTLEFHADSPENTKVCVPDSIADLIDDTTDDSQPAPDATLKS